MSEIPTLYAAVAAGGAIGLRHAFEPDHLAAVVNIVDEEARSKSAKVGALWGAGHTVPIALSGVALFALGVRVPESVSGWFELLAGAILVYLGARTLLNVANIERHEHDEGSDSEEDGHGHDHPHDHSHSDEHTHLSVGPVSIGGTHSHYENESFLVGIVHGLAGSGIVVVLVAPTAPTKTAAVGFVGAFALASVATMGALSFIWGAALGFKEHAPKIRAVAGVVSIVVGVTMGLAFFGIADIGAHDHGVDGREGAEDADGHDHGGGTEGDHEHGGEHDHDHRATTSIQKGGTAWSQVN